jgi:hypothetical protein
MTSDQSAATRDALAWSPTRKSDGARTDGGYWYGICPHGDYESESHWEGHARAALTTHLRKHHPVRTR